VSIDGVPDEREDFRSRERTRRGADSAAHRDVPIVILLVLAALSAACARVEASRDAVQVDMANVDLHVSADVTLHVQRLQGSFVPVGRDVPYLEDKQSYGVVVTSGQVAIDLASLNALMTRATGGGKSNVHKLRVSFKDGELREQGVIDSKIDVPFTSAAVISATADGRIRVHARSISGFGVPVTPVLKLLHLQLDNMVHVKSGTGVETDGNDLIIDPSRLIPAPRIRGHLTDVRIVGQRMVQTFGGDAMRAIAPRTLSPNHIYWRGSQLSFGKLMMSDTDLELVDMDPKDPFDFSVDHWSAQLVAGYSKTLPDKGLIAFMPDYSDLK
jgi:hypothetical protein